MCRKKSPIMNKNSRDMSVNPEGPTPDVFPKSECPLIKLNETEYRLFKNGTVALLNTNTSYNSSQYVFIDEQLYLCVNFTQNYTLTNKTDVDIMTFTFSLTEAVVSTCGICISLVALAVTIFVYLSLRALRNIPGQNLLSLVCSLFLADLLLFVAPSAEEEYLACAVIAAVMNYFFLAAFFWMNVTAVDVWFTFSKVFVRAGDRGQSSKRFVRYSAYAWITPLVIVLSAAVVQMVTPESTVSPGYGDGICWLNNKLALLFFFAAPVFLLITLNIVFFLLSARNIFRAKRATSRVLGNEGEGQMGVYVKLTVAMGLTWILGLVTALLPHIQVLTYCFIIMNTLQGLFIFLSFVCTRKVFALLKDKFCRRNTPTASSQLAAADQTSASKSPSAPKGRKLKSMDEISPVCG